MQAGLKACTTSGGSGPPQGLPLTVVVQAFRPASVRPETCTFHGMFTNRPRRLEGIQYVGFQRYFLTICSAFKRQVFLSSNTVDPAMLQLRQTATLFEFAIVAYCFMPDHVHILLIAESER